MPCDYMVSMELAERACVPCSRESLLDAARVAELAVEIPSWHLDETADGISRRFTFKSFVHAAQFLYQVAVLAEEEGHYPDVTIRGNTVDVTCRTHEIGGLHENDFIMAAKIGILAIAETEDWR